MLRRQAFTACLLLAAALLTGGCATFGHKEKPPPPPPPPPGTALTPEADSGDEEPLPVTPVSVPIVVAAWAEPKQLPTGGGQAQIMVRIQKQGGKRFAGVEVRLRSSSGTLFSAGRVLVTDASGMTRDRLTAHKTTTITLNAGGTRYRLQVPVAEPLR
jgi:hypothetical protein